MAPPPLQFEIMARCSTTRARASRLILPHGTTLTPGMLDSTACPCLAVFDSAFHSVHAGSYPSNDQRLDAAASS